MSSKIKISLAWQMMIGLALGIVVGALVDSSFAQTWLQPLGDLFIRLIRMVVVPLVLATIIAGAAGISDTSKLGRVAVKVLLVYAVTTGIAVACGSIPGATLGAKRIPKVPERQLRFLFAGFLVVAAGLLVVNQLGVWG